MSVAGLTGNISNIENCLAVVVCPVSGQELHRDPETETLISADGNWTYPVEDGIPILLPPETVEPGRTEGPGGTGHTTPRPGFRDGPGPETPSTETLRHYWDAYQVFVPHYGDLGKFFALPRDEQAKALAAHEAHTDECYPWQKEAFDYPQVRGKRFLEIGFGQGEQFARYCREQPSCAVGIDFSLSAAKLTMLRLELLGLKAVVLIADARRLPFRSDCFDFVACHGVLHHIPDAHHAAGEITRVLGSNGDALVMVYNRHSYFNWISVNLKNRLLIHAINKYPNFLGRRVLQRYPWAARLSLPKDKRINQHTLLSASTETAGTKNPFSAVYSKGSFRRLFGDDFAYRFRSYAGHVPFTWRRVHHVWWKNAIMNVADKLRSVRANLPHRLFGGFFLFCRLRKVN